MRTGSMFRPDRMIGQATVSLASADWRESVFQRENKVRETHNYSIDFLVFPYIKAKLQVDTMLAGSIIRFRAFILRDELNKTNVFSFPWGPGNSLEGYIPSAGTCIVPRPRLNTPETIFHRHHRSTQRHSFGRIR